MALIDIADIKQEMSSMAKRLADIRGSLDLPVKQERIGELEERMLAPDFWDDNDAAQKTISELNALKGLVETMGKLDAQYEDLQVMLELIIEEGDDSMIQDVYDSTQALKKEFESFELELLLSDQYDKNNAILELHPGAGGTESQDWASMLLRMYTRWGESKGFKVETLDYLPGDEAGVKSVTLLIKGHNAYGYLKSEKGVHRLVRISPFDSSGRRHTSFVSCNVLPEIEDDTEVNIRTEDLKIDTYRSSGAGGQHINTTDSAVRITHLPTGIVVTCQTERSQIKNRERAMKMLAARLFEKKREEQEKTLQAIQGEQKDIAWGSQIRSYVFHPYSLVKDHRTNVEVGNVQAVMDGDIDSFIDAYLRSQINRPEQA
ncbi:MULTISPECIES: peptide chain release factor 2 [Brevibacillus]|nr:peptide chain release factor 2 [Brevibacillus borstelensis]MBE5396818.1 peptide chain release factor 2 [Brevibacillus borstelensis]MCC0566212.1 peptide chain release factor 2 [Brevibacillus borstelensis]MCM3470966.1 peptide chain release factor 2 [Brevibacillus borstelensis]MCM3559934.1 peptide chain release factor 2 [Brevibacillus borstelensis]MCM3590210.1 peptide chain release factor 2 [Brevibacillus borstelensis]